MGKSASGKDTIFKKILDTSKELNTIVSYTTRPIRDGEIEGVEYHFVDENYYQQMKRDGKVVESRTYKTVMGPWTYFTLDDNQIDLSIKNYLVIGTLESYISMAMYYGENAVVPIYVELDDGIRLERALKREREQAVPRYEEMCRRFLADAEDFSEDHLRNVKIERRFVNDNSDVVVREIMDFIRSECSGR